MLFTDPNNDPKHPGFVRKKPNFRTTDKSYEAVLIEKYMTNIEEETKSKQLSTPVKTRRSKLEIESPYLQKLSHSNLITNASIFNNRPSSSATVRDQTLNNTRANSRQSTVRNRPSSACNIENKYDVYKQMSSRFLKSESANDFNKSANQSTQNKIQFQNMSVRDRPSSAPLNRSEADNNRRSFKNSRKSVLRQPNMIKAIAYRNGNRHYSVFIAAKNLIEFLVLATDKLGFPRAARRVFLENGDEIKDDSQFFKNAPVYVSCGEDFEDPFQQTKRITDKRNRTLWLSNGIQILGEQSNQATCKPSKYTERQAKSIKLTKRLVALENGQEHTPTVVVLEIKNPDIQVTDEEASNKTEQDFMADFLDECTFRMKMTTTARAVYNWLGERVSTINDIPKLDKCLQPLVCRSEYTPVWVSRGEGFDAYGALKFVENLFAEIKEVRKDLVGKKSKLQVVFNGLRKDRSSKKPVKLQRIENAESLKQSKAEILEVDGSIAYLKTVIECLEAKRAEQLSGQSTLFNHIKEVEVGDRIFGGLASKPLKLKVCLNGSTEDKFFEVQISAKDLKIWDHVLTEIDNAYYRYDRLNYAKFTRLFDESGVELKELYYATHNKTTVWASTGDNWKDPKANILFALSIKLNTLVPILKSAQADAGQLTEENENIEPTSEAELQDADSFSSADDNMLSDENEKELANFFKSKSNKFSKKANKNKPRKQVSGNPFGAEKPGNPFETGDQFSFKTYTEVLRPERLVDFCKPDDWDILTEHEASLIVAEVVSDQTPGVTTFMDDTAQEINQRRALELLLQAKNEKSLLLHPKLSVNQKIPIRVKDLIWYTDFQIWKFNQDGLIYNSFFSKICLTVNKRVTIELQINLKPSDTNKEPQTITKTGYLVTLSHRNPNSIDIDQRWSFTKYGNIVSRSLNNNICLTSMDILETELNSLKKGPVDNFEFKIASDSNCYETGDVNLMLMENFQPLPKEPIEDSLKSRINLMKELGKCQRWAIKQDKREAKSNREWKLSTLATNKWLREAYSWPVNDQEEYINEFTWPISGHLISCAPILKTLEDSNSEDTGKLTLRISKNGSFDEIIPLTISRMEFNPKYKELKAAQSKDPKTAQTKKQLHCTGVSYLQLELDMFLSKCSSVLHLPNAARRLFTEKGDELTSLDKLEQDQLVIVSTGEAWIPPKTVKDEVATKQMLANLTDDLTKIAYFNRLKTSCRNFVIEAYKSTVSDGARMVVGRSYLDESQLERVRQGESLQAIFGLEEKKIVVQEDSRSKKAHEKSHENIDAEEKKKLRWPWEKIANKSLDLMSEKKSVDADSIEEDDDDDVLFDTLKVNRPPDYSKTTLKIPKLSSQKFAFDKFNGFIYSIETPNLVLAVADIDNNLIEVFLMKKNDDNPFQRWIYSNEGSILLKCRQSLALTVKIPSIENCDMSLGRSKESTQFNSVCNINEAPLILQNLIETENGNANQKWFIEESVGLIFAFAPTYDKTYDANDQMNIEITAANKAKICTSYVTGPQEIPQPGYVCEYPVHIKSPARPEESTQNQAADNHKPAINNNANSVETKLQKVFICNCCAVSVRGKYRLNRLTKNQSFACYFGQSKEKSVRQNGGFKYLYNKVDLSSKEAEKSFHTWKDKLIEAKEMTTVKPVLNESSAVKTTNIIKLYAYKNGDGRLKPGELLIGTNLNELLELATAKLQLNNAARRIYTQDGGLILDVQDLVTWCIDHYRKQMQILEPTEQKLIRQPKSVGTPNTTTGKPSAKDLFKKSESSQSSKSFSDPADPQKNTTKGTSQESIFSRDDSLRGQRKPFRGLTKPNKSDLKRLIFELERFDRSKTSDLKKVLKWPVEVWISSGENFIQPEVVCMNENQRLKQREAIDRAENELEKKIHELRQMTGRRMVAKNSGAYVSTASSGSPVTKEGHWQDVPYEEQVKQAEINKLKSFVDDMKNPNRRNKKLKSNINTSFGSHSITKRIFIYINGHSPESSKSCWASSLEELNEVAYLKLGLNKPIKLFFTEEGNTITTFKDLTRDQLVCVSTGRDFIPATLANRDIEIKANWSRVCKEEGLKATLINVNSRQNLTINVDPFAPSLNSSKNGFLALEDTETADLRDRYFSRSKSNDSAEENSTK